MLGDDDTVFLADNIVALLSTYDHRTPTYIGGVTNERRSYTHWGKHGTPIVTKDVPWEGFLYGGGGVLVSAELMAQLAGTFEQCLLRYRWVRSSKWILSKIH